MTSIAVAVCAPWTARNCVRMHRCALVSVNAGWNLLIGADGDAGGTWAPLRVPPACREVFDEAAKDRCFGRAAVENIAADPRRWLARVPAKLAATFDYAGAGGFYLHASNPAAFGERAKWTAGAAETAYERVAALAALVAAARLPGPRRRLRTAVALAGAPFLFVEHAVVAVLALAAAIALLGRALLRGPVLPGATLACIVATAVAHAVFFGAGRYGLVVLPLVTAMGAATIAQFALSLTARPRSGDTERLPREE